MIFLGLCERIIAAAPRRNLAVHGQWVRQSDHNDEPAAVSWFKVPVDEPIKKLYPAELPPLTVEAGAISKALYELLDHRGAFAAIAE